MKKVAMVLLCILVLKVQSQESIHPVKDSVKTPKNELGFNLLPIITIFSSSIPSESVKYSLHYRHYVNPKNAIRVSVSILPFENYFIQKDNGEVNFQQVSDTFLIYKSSISGQNPKSQLNLGYERILSNRKLIQSVGADLFVNYQHRESKEEYYWTGKSSPLNKNYYSVSNPNYNVVDTLGNNRVSDNIGVGFHVFYNLRIPISKHWLLSTTIGPSLTLASNRVRTTVRKTGVTASENITNLDFDGNLFSDLSICYRF